MLYSRDWCIITQPYFTFLKIEGKKQTNLKVQVTEGRCCGFHRDLHGKASEKGVPGGMTRSWFSAQEDGAGIECDRGWWPLLRVVDFRGF